MPLLINFPDTAFKYVSPKRFLLVLFEVTLTTCKSNVGWTSTAL